jgi:RNA polymerase sigma-70 factor (ECF subfamily)
MSDAPNPDDTSRERFRMIVLPHLDAAYRLSRWLTRDASKAQDLTQDAVLRALRYFHAFHGEQARAWLLRIVRNTWLDGRRTERTTETLDAAEQVAADTPDPEQGAIAGDRRQIVARALSSLPQPLREILVLREIEDLSYKQIAEVLDMPIGTVMSRLARAREKLAETLVASLGRSEHGLRDL